MAWVLMQTFVDSMGRSVTQRSYHDVRGKSTRARAATVIERLGWVDDIRKTILLLRAEHDPGEFKIEGEDKGGTWRCYFFQQVPEDELRQGSGLF